MSEWIQEFLVRFMWKETIKFLSSFLTGESYKPPTTVADIYPHKNTYIFRFFFNGLFSLRIMTLYQLFLVIFQTKIPLTLATKVLVVNATVSFKSYGVTGTVFS